MPTTMQQYAQYMCQRTSVLSTSSLLSVSCSCLCHLSCCAVRRGSPRRSSTKARSLVPSLMAYTNASYAPAAALVVPVTGGTRTSIWDQLYSCKLIGRQSALSWLSAVVGVLRCVSGNIVSLQLKRFAVIGFCKLQCRECTAACLLVRNTISGFFVMTLCCCKLPGRQSAQLAECSCGLLKIFLRV